MKNLSAFVFLIAGVACGMTPAMAQNAPSPTSQTENKTPAKKAPAAKKKQAPVEAADEKEPDIGGLIPTTFDCELGNKLTIYHNASDDQQIALRWNKRLHQLSRVSTSTGANRFENTSNGLVWIGIPAKGMLLDSKKGQQLANECKSAEQATQKSLEQKGLGIAQ